MKVEKVELSIENIKEMRQREGIIDADLITDIRRLKAGDRVKISLATDRHGFETVSIQLTSARDGILRGRLLKKPKSPALRGLIMGTLLKFGAEHIHSIVGRQNSAMCMDRSTPTPSRDQLLRAARLEADLECDRHQVCEQR